MIKELLFLSLCIFAVSTLIDAAPQKLPLEPSAPDVELMETAETKSKGGGGGSCCGGGHGGGGGGHYRGGGGHYRGGGGGGGGKGGGGGGKGFKKG